MSLGNAFPVRSTIPDVYRVQGVWTGGGAAANCSHVSTDWSVGISSVAYNAATGKYLVTFQDVGQQIVYADAKVSGLTGEDPVTCNVLRGTFSIANKTVEVEFSDLTGALIDLLATDKVQLVFEFSKNAPNA